MAGNNMLRTYQDAVAGAASGIGRALAEELARRGAEVVLADLPAESAEEAAAGIRARGGKAAADSSVRRLSRRRGRRCGCRRGWSSCHPAR